MTTHVRPTKIPDYYGLLKVPQTATLTEIRNAYKKRVLEAHPDKNPHRAEWSERRIRELFEAFEVLGDTAKRADYDERSRIVSRARGGHAKGNGGARRRPPTENDLFFFRKEDPECQALRVLYFLLHGRGEEAILLLSESEQRFGGGFLADQLERSDYLDCLFLVGEHLIKKRRYHDALDRFLSLYRADRPTRFRRHYFHLVVEHLKTLYMRYLPRSLSPEKTIESVEEVFADLPWTAKERARLYLILSKSYQKLEKRGPAREHLKKALSADPGFAHAKRWEAELAAEGKGC